MPQKIELDFSIDTTAAKKSAEDLQKYLESDWLGALHKQLRSTSKELDDLFKKQMGLERLGLGKSAEAKDINKQVAVVHKAHRAVADEVLKSEKELERRRQSDPNIKHPFLHRLLFGSKTPQEATRSARSELGNFQQRLRQDAVLFQTVVRTLTGSLPGGNLAVAATSGLVQGFQEGLIDPRTGERRGGLAGYTRAGLRGVGQMALTGGMAALASGIASGIQGSTEEGMELLHLARAAGGSAETGARAYRQIRPSGLTYQEGAAISAQALRGGSSAEAAMRVESIAGLGGQFAGLGGAVAQAGGYRGMDFGGKGGIDEQAKQMWVDIFASGLAQGMKGGRVAELIAGATAMANRTLLGTVLSQGATSQMARMSTVLGAGGRGEFEGARSYQMMQIMNSMAQGQGSPMARAMGLKYMGGLGEEGKGLFGAEVQMEAGLFGERPGETKKTRTTAGQRFNKLMGGLVQAFGTDPETLGKAVYETYKGTGMTAGAASALSGRYLKGERFDETTLKGVIQQYQTPEQKKAAIEEEAFKTMADMGGPMREMQKVLSDLSRTLATFVNRVIPSLTSAIEQLNIYLRVLSGVPTAEQSKRGKTMTEEIVAEGLPEPSEEVKEVFARSGQRKFSLLPEGVEDLAESARAGYAAVKDLPGVVRAIRGYTRKATRQIETAEAEEAAQMASAETIETERRLREEEEARTSVAKSRAAIAEKEAREAESRGEEGLPAWVKLDLRLQDAKLKIQGSEGVLSAQANASAAAAAETGR